jgi:hypothetical protein
MGQARVIKRLDKPAVSLKVILIVDYERGKRVSWHKSQDVCDVQVQLSIPIPNGATPALS